MRKIALIAILLASAGAATPAAAVSPCLKIGSPMPPPCLVVDTKKILEHINTIKNAKERLENLTRISENLADINKIMGAKAQSDGKPVKAWVPLAPGEEISFAKAANEMAAVMPQTSELTASENDTQRAAMIIAERAASGDGWSISYAMKERLVGMNNDGTLLAKAMTQCSTTLRRDWQINTHAKLLYLRSLVALRELRQAEALQDAIGTVNYEPTKQMETHGRAEPGNYEPQYGRDDALILAQIAMFTVKLLALRNGQEAANIFTGTIREIDNTRIEYEGLEQIARETDRALAAQAAQTASRTGRDPKTLLEIVNRVMAQYDRTTWDTPEKEVIARRAADMAVNQLEKYLRTDVSDNWVKLLMARAEAYKQAAFFKEYAASSEQYKQATIEAQKAYSAGLETDISDAKAMAAKIAQLEAEIAALKASLATASPEVQKRAQDIMQQLMIASGSVSPNTAPSPAQTPTPPPAFNLQ